MAASQQKAPAEAKSPIEEWIFREFGGMNTQAYRTSIKDQEFSWLENAMPIGEGNIKVVPAQSASQQTVASGTAVYAMSFNIAGIDYHFVVCSDGSAYQIKSTTPFTRVLIAAAGTFTGTAGSVWAAQWKNERIVIVDSAHGASTWDGTALFKNGEALSIDFTGVGYVAGTGYLVGNVVNLTLGAPGAGATATVTSIDGGGGITGATITNHGSGYLANYLATVTGGAGINAKLPVQVMAIVGAGNLIATYASRVWVANGRTITYTDANSYNSIGGSGGSFVIPDAALHDVVTGLQPANNFLYIFGSASAQAISDVRVQSGIAVFSNTTVQTSVGTTFPMSLFSYYRSLMFFTPFGMYAMYGATPTKASDELDGVLPLVDLTKQVSGGACIIYNQLCAVFAFTYLDPDPALGTRKLLAVFFNKKWFVSSQGNVLFVWADTVAGVQTIFGTDGTNVFTLFSDSTASISSKVQTKLYPFESSLMDTNALRFGVETIIPAQLANLGLSIDSEAGSVAYTLNNSNVITFNGIGPISFVGVGPIVFLGVGFTTYSTQVDNWGKYLGATIESTAAQLQITTLMMEYKKHTKGLW